MGIPFIQDATASLSRIRKRLCILFAETIRLEGKTISGDMLDTGLLARLPILFSYFDHPTFVAFIHTINCNQPSL